MSPKTVAVFTANRSEYGLLRGVLRAIDEDEDLRLRLIVGGTHLSQAHGMTVEEIIADGFSIHAQIPMPVGSDGGIDLVEALAECVKGVGHALAGLLPDLFLLLGDRFELLAAASAATVLRIPIAHISGGDVTTGAIDNQVRHALTKMSHLHLVGTSASADRVLQMGEDPAHVLVTGEPGLDEFFVGNVPTRQELAAELGLNRDANWIILTYHPETLASSSVDLARLDAILNALAERTQVQIVMNAANQDLGGAAINQVLQRHAAATPEKLFFIPSLGHRRFVALMRQALCIVGNSSAGIVEAAAVPIPAIDIGKRQAGRSRPRNVIHIAGDRRSVDVALAQVEDPAFRSSLVGMVNPYGDGRAADRIKVALKTFLQSPIAAKGFRTLADQCH